MCINKAFVDQRLTDDRRHTLTFSHMFPQWIMNQIKRSGDVDPLLPSATTTPFDHSQLRADIMAQGNVTAIRANQFIESLQLESKCEAMIKSLHERQRCTPPIVRVTTFDYQIHGLHYVKFHASLDHLIVCLCLQFHRGRKLTGYATTRLFHLLMTARVL